MPSAKAAVLRRIGAQMTIETVDVGRLAAGDVLARLRVPSLRHTDLQAIEGSIAVALPAVLGHEAAGEVAETGPTVTGLRPRDRVVLSWNPHCGICFYCEHGQPILWRQFIANAATRCAAW
jgi:S-(hydroxymethyl)glutathione dehydrogenase/alcohol dehydrogenase